MVKHWYRKKTIDIYFIIRTGYRDREIGRMGKIKRNSKRIDRRESKYTNKEYTKGSEVGVLYSR